MSPLEVEKSTENRLGTKARAANTVGPDCDRKKSSPQRAKLSFQLDVNFVGAKGNNPAAIRLPNPLTPVYAANFHARKITAI